MNGSVRRPREFGEVAHNQGELPRVVGLNHLMDDDPSLRSLLDLPPEWEAERATEQAAWERKPIDPG